MDTRIGIIVEDNKNISDTIFSVGSFFGTNCKFTNCEFAGCTFKENCKFKKCKFDANCTLTKTCDVDECTFPDKYIRIVT